MCARSVSHLHVTDTGARALVTLSARDGGGES